MEKPIIATTLSGLFIKSEPWDKAHIIWYENAAKQLKDNSVKQWINKPNYFEGVDEVMKRLYPDLSDEQRTIKAREMFFDSVLQYIHENLEVKNKEVVNYFQSIKNKYQLALITTNTKSALKRILKLTDLENMFDLIETSKAEEKDDKKIVFNRFIKQHEKPIIYIGGARKDSYDYCKEHGIKRIFANLEGDEDIEEAENVHDLRELKEKIESL